LQREALTGNQGCSLGKLRPGFEQAVYTRKHAYQVNSANILASANRHRNVTASRSKHASRFTDERKSATSAPQQRPQQGVCQCHLFAGPSPRLPCKPHSPAGTTRRASRLTILCAGRAVARQVGRARTRSISRAVWRLKLRYA